MVVILLWQHYKGSDGMGVSPLLMNGIVGRTQDYSTIKQNEDNKYLVDQLNAHTQFEHKVNQHISTVREADDTENRNKKFDAKEKGDGQYSGDGGNKRKNQESMKQSDKVIIKNKGGFDIKI